MSKGDKRRREDTAKILKNWPFKDKKEKNNENRIEQTDKFSHLKNKEG